MTVIRNGRAFVFFSRKALKRDRARTSACLTKEELSTFYFLRFFVSFSRVIVKTWHRHEHQKRKKFAYCAYCCISYIFICLFLLLFDLKSKKGFYRKRPKNYKFKGENLKSYIEPLLSSLCEIFCEEILSHFLFCLFRFFSLLVFTVFQMLMFMCLLCQRLCPLNAFCLNVSHHFLLSMTSISNLLLFDCVWERQTWNT